MSNTQTNPIAFLDCSGPEFDIVVQGKRYHFEMHPYCGPVALTKRGEPAKHQPQAFLYAASLWARGAALQREAAALEKEKK